MELCQRVGQRLTWMRYEITSLGWYILIHSYHMESFRVILRRIVYTLDNWRVSDQLFKQKNIIMRYAVLLIKNYKRIWRVCQDGVVLTEGQKNRLCFLMKPMENYLPNQGFNNERGRNLRIIKKMSESSLWNSSMRWKSDWRVKNDT